MFGSIYHALGGWAAYNDDDSSMLGPKNVPTAPGGRQEASGPATTAAAVGGGDTRKCQTAADAAEEVRPVFIGWIVPVFVLYRGLTHALVVCLHLAGRHPLAKTAASMNWLAN